MMVILKVAMRHLARGADRQLFDCLDDPDSQLPLSLVDAGHWNLTPYQAVFAGINKIPSLGDSP